MKTLLILTLVAAVAVAVASVMGGFSDGSDWLTALGAA